MSRRESAPAADRTGEAAARLSVVVVYYGGAEARAVLSALLDDPTVAEVILVNNLDGPAWPTALGEAPPTVPLIPADKRTDFFCRLAGAPLASLRGASLKNVGRRGEAAYGLCPDESGQRPIGITAPPRLRLIHGQGNVGFGAGCNLGVAEATGDLVLMLNPDCLPAPGALTGVLALAARQPDDAWTIGVRLLGPDGTEQVGGRRNAGTPGQWLGQAFGGHLARVNRHTEPLPTGDLVEIPAISGAFMLMPVAFYRRLGGFDAGYFLHFEDLALCRAVWRAGGRVLFAPRLTATHLKSRSPVSGLFVTRAKIRSCWRYFTTEFRPEGAPVWWLALVWAVLSGGLLAKTLLRGGWRTPG